MIKVVTKNNKEVTVRANDDGTVTIGLIRDGLHQACYVILPDSNRHAIIKNSHNLKFMGEC